MHLRSSLADLLISGNGDLTSQQLDLKIEQNSVAVSTKHKSQLEEKDTPVPIVVSGTFNSPEFSFNEKGLSTREIDLLLGKIDIQALVDEKLPSPKMRT